MKVLLPNLPLALVGQVCDDKARNTLKSGHYIF